LVKTILRVVTLDDLKWKRGRFYIDEKKVSSQGLHSKSRKGGILNSIGWRDSHITMIGGEHNRIDFFIKFVGLLS
jgi:hypothetical protein